MEDRFLQPVSLPDRQAGSIQYPLSSNRMPKVLLINTNIEKSPYPVPPLGLCMLANTLEPGFDLKIYDGVFDEGNSLPEVVSLFKPDYIGFSIRNIDDVVADRHIFYIPGIIEKFIEPVKKLTGVPIILGGSGFSMFPEELMKMTGADYGIIGEGEMVFPQLLSYLEKSHEITTIPNVINKALVITGGTVFKSQLSIPSGFPEMDRRIDFTPYMQKSVYSVQTKKGCSHGCIYCTYPVIEGRQFRKRNPLNIVDEIEQAHHRLGHLTFEIVDSTFNDPKGHAEAFCREIIRRKLNVKLRTMGINPRNVSPGLFELMMEAGFTQIDATPDSASEKMLKKLDKGFTLREVQNMASLIKQFDLPTMWFFLFSGPGEDEKTFSETMEFIDSYINPDDLVYMNAGLRVYPGTPLYKIALKEGRINANQSLLYPPVYYYSDQMGKERVDQLIHEAAMSRPNCLPSLDTKPQPEMVREAIELRASESLTEPIFRTLLRIRKKWIIAGKLKLS
jgi:radical SAM superfamily enzyme YgiQ (UPF0313 family)